MIRRQHESRARRTTPGGEQVALERKGKGELCSALRAEAAACWPPRARDAGAQVLPTGGDGPCSYRSSRSPSDPRARNRLDFEGRPRIGATVHRSTPHPVAVRRFSSTQVNERSSGAA